MKMKSEAEQVIWARIQKVTFELSQLQSMLNEQTIAALWLNFRECENKQNGRIPKKEFRNGVEQVWFTQSKCKNWTEEKKRQVVDLIFERFKYLPDQESIEIYDFLISMSILSRISNDGKIELILQLIDVDEDRCLSIGEVFKMILAIEKNFVKELNYLNF